MVRWHWDYMVLIFREERLHGLEFGKHYILYLLSKIQTDHSLILEAPSSLISIKLWILLVLPLSGSPFSIAFTSLYSFQGSELLEFTKVKSLAPFMVCYFTNLIQFHCFGYMWWLLNMYLCLKFQTHIHISPLESSAWISSPINMPKFLSLKPQIEPQPSFSFLSLGHHHHPFSLTSQKNPHMCLWHFNLLTSNSQSISKYHAFALSSKSTSDYFHHCCQVCLSSLGFCSSLKSVSPYSFWCNALPIVQQNNILKCKSHLLISHLKLFKASLLVLG